MITAKKAREIVDESKKNVNYILQTIEQGIIHHANNGKYIMMYDVSNNLPSGTMMYIADKLNESGYEVKIDWDCVSSCTSDGSAVEIVNRFTIYW